MSEPSPDCSSPEPYLAVKAAMMPRDTNPYGTIFGGVILSYLDQAGAIGAAHVLRQRGFPKRLLVTVGMKSIEFHRPVWVGDIVSFYTEVVRIGRTSITMHVSVETERDENTIQLTEAEVTYVAVEGSPQAQRTIPLRAE
ncbi:MAG: acyl-CoA thioesterase [Planctomycetota bacterium]|nr:acyl-CoA thioesterase [Planctomycetota bacterium]